VSVLDVNWETINGPVAHQIELTNAANQANVVKCLISFLLAHRGPSGACPPPPPDEPALLTLHHAGTLFLLAHPGAYRNHDVQVYGKPGEISFTPMSWQFVEGAMKRFFRDLYAIWQTGDALEASAYALWGINYIHPFRNGNGRTARAFSYACLSLRIGAELPGSITLMQMMTEQPHSSRYKSLLTEIDKTYLSGSLNLQPIKDFLLELLNLQIASANPVV